MNRNRLNAIRQLEAWDIQNPSLLNAISCIDRTPYLPSDQHHLADLDVFTPLSNGYHLVPIHFTAKLLNAVAFEPIKSVLCIGCGSGYELTLLANLCTHLWVAEPSSSNIHAIKPLMIHHKQSIEWLELDAYQHSIDTPKFDMIWCHGALPNCPEHLLNQLHTHGVLLAMIGSKGPHKASVYQKSGQNTVVFEAQFPHYPHLSNEHVFTF